jgi:CubicO group peptidase (beta-lactamase class C family)
MPRPYGAELMAGLQDAVDSVARETNFSGVARVEREGSIEVEAAYGLAHRGLEIPNGVETRFGIASGTKGLTAVTVMSLIEDGTLELSTTARSLLGDDLPLIRDDVTVEHLLSHTSGIGDYFDEDVHTDAAAYVMPIPIHELATTEQYLAVLDGHEPKFEPGQGFSYSNSGYVVLALLAERASGTSFPELVRLRVCEPAGMSDTAFLRSDELPGGVALGYLEVEGSRTNLLHLPVRGSGDGGIYTTVADVSAFWRAFFDGALVSTDAVAEMVKPHSEEYGLGFWLDGTRGHVRLEGSDAGVSFYTLRSGGGSLFTVISNTTAGAWPIARLFLGTG